MKENVYLFTDGSVNTQSKMGYGAYLWVNDLTENLNVLKSQVQSIRFDDTSSTKLEIQTLLHALHELKSIPRQLTIYTDSQNIVGLLERRSRLEAKNYSSKKNDQIENTALYKSFYQWHDKLNFEIVKVKGHKKSHLKDTIDQIFTLVDKAARNGLRSNSK